MPTATLSNVQLVAQKYLNATDSFLQNDLRYDIPAYMIDIRVVSIKQSCIMMIFIFPIRNKIVLRLTVRFISFFGIASHGEIYLQYFCDSLHDILGASSTMDDKNFDRVSQRRSHGRRVFSAVQLSLYRPDAPSPGSGAL